MKAHQLFLILKDFNRLFRYVPKTYHALNMDVNYTPHKHDDIVRELYVNLQFASE